MKSVDAANPHPKSHHVKKHDGVKSAKAVEASSGTESIPASYQWPPKGRIGEFTIKWGTPQNWGGMVGKTAWTVDVTWHRTEGQPPDYKHCKIEDWDRGGHGCPANTVDLFTGDDSWPRHNISLDENEKYDTAKGKMHLNRTDTGWLGVTVLEPKDKQLGQGLLMVYLSDLGKAGCKVGLWVPSQKKFYYMDEKSFLQDPNAPLKPTLEKDALTPSALPAPFSAHGKNLDDPPGLAPFQHKAQHHVSWRMEPQDGKVAWKIDDFVMGDGNKTFTLTPGKEEVRSPARGIFRTWKREKNRWVSVSEDCNIYPTSFGVVDKSRMRLALHDNGVAILSVEEERVGGEKRVYRLDPSLLAKMGEPKVLSVKRLAPNQSFESYYTDEMATQEHPLRSMAIHDRSFQPDLGVLTLGGVAI